MASQVQYRRGTNAQNAAFTGALAEITVDTTNGTLRVHDAITAGGSNIATVAYVTAQIGALSANSISSGTSNVRVVSSGGNVATSVGGTSNVMVVSSTDVTITGNLSVTGNATLSGNILGDRIQNGTTTIDIQTTGGNANITVGGTSNVAVFATTGAFITGLMSVSGNITGGNLSGTNIVGTLTTAAQTNITSVGTLGSVSVTGNVQGGNLRTAGLISATGAITGASVVGGVMTGTSVSVTGAVTGASVVGGVMTGTSVSVTGAVTGASVVGGVMSGSSLTVTTGTITGGNIVNANANGVGNIGSATTFFNTVFAKATSAQYADLAEKYTADADYSPGTVIEFGGINEVTITTGSHSAQVAGIVSTNPSYLMNSGLVGQNVIDVALVGRVPCQVVGTIAKGDRLVASSIPGIATRLDIAQYQPGCIIGKALQSYDSETVGTIEVAVGRI